MNNICFCFSGRLRIMDVKILRSSFDIKFCLAFLSSLFVDLLIKSSVIALELIKLSNDTVGFLFLLLVFLFLIFLFVIFLLFMLVHRLLILDGVLLELILLLVFLKDKKLLKEGLSIRIDFRFNVLDSQGVLKIDFKL